MTKRATPQPGPTLLATLARDHMAILLARAELDSATGNPNADTYLAELKDIQLQMEQEIDKSSRVAKTLRGMTDDIAALRLGPSDTLSDDSELEPEDCFLLPTFEVTYDYKGVFVEWPNLAIMAREAEDLLK